MPIALTPSEKMRVLIVDDIQISRTILASMVSALGYEVLEADQGETALALFAQAQPDMVLLDLLMPGMDGFEVTAKMKAQCGAHWVPIVVVSGLDGDEHLLAALQAGADDFLHKPVQRAILVNKLANIARVLHLQRQNAALLQQSMAISENSFDAILVLDAQGLIHMVNGAAERLFECQRAIMMGADINRFLPQLGRTQWHADSASAAVQKLEALTATGSFIAVEAGVSQFEQDGLHYHLLTLRDISERERVDQLKERFISTLSHELRTPLTSIMGAIKILQSPKFAQLDQRGTDLLSMADRNAGRLLQMVNELLDFNKVSAGVLQLDLREYELQPLLDEVLQAHQGYAAKYQVELQLACSGPDLPVQLSIDRGRFIQIMGNLLSNACKYSPPGQIVLIKVYQREQQLCLEVIDQGNGVPASFQPYLFEPFTQADASDARLLGGSGLGLAITRQLCQALGGTISYRDGEPKGSVFVFCLPLGVSVCSH